MSKHGGVVPQPRRTKGREQPHLTSERPRLSATGSSVGERWTTIRQRRAEQRTRGCWPWYKDPLIGTEGAREA